MDIPKWKTLMKKYGILFFVSTILTFFLLITFDGRFNFPNFVGDLRFGSVYLPFGSSLAAGAFITIMFEAYKIFKHS